MIIRLSDKLRKKLKISPGEVLPQDPNPFADWSAHLFIANHLQYIIATNTKSLYSVVFQGKGITTSSKFVAALTDNIRETLQADGYLPAFEKHILPSIENIQFSKALNRSVTGSMTDFIHVAKFYIVAHSTSLPMVIHDLNIMPMSYLNYDGPHRAFGAMVDEYGERLKR